ncbi:MAG TPA: hypothetical protein VFV18_03160 [Porticoccaceae bacterium]|nr:hypothetical protein [Porticoccaceae bacterium]
MNRFIVKLAVGMLALCSLSAQAHYLVTSTGKLYYHSLGCETVLKSVPNPDAKPGMVECVASTATVELLCRNPANNNVAPGQSATQVVLVASERIDESDITDKAKGKANVTVIIEDDALLKPEYCVNPNWIPEQVLIRTLSARVNAYACTGDGLDPCDARVLTSHLEKTCTLPTEYDFNNPPISGVTEYQCTEPVIVHDS